MKLSGFKDLIKNMPVPQQAYTSKRSTWEPKIQKSCAGRAALLKVFGHAPIATVSRNDLRVLSAGRRLDQFVIATIIWGYPNGMRGNNFANLVHQYDKITELLMETRGRHVLDWRQHYKKVEAITGLGLSTYTKFLSFLAVSVEKHRALILDDRIIKVARRCVFEELDPLCDLTTSNATRRYPEYLARIYEIATAFCVPAENIEYFLFEFGLNLKPTNRAK